MTRSPVPPFVHTLLCGRRLYDLRQQAGLTQGDVAVHCGWGQVKVARIERGDQRVTPADLGTLLELLAPSDDERAKIHLHAEEGAKQAPRGHLRWKFRGNEMRKVVDLEESAPRLSGHVSMVLPGLLQTEDYIADLARRERPALAPVAVDEFVANRLERQRVLANPDQEFDFVIDEAALARMQNMGGSSTIMKAQLRRLRELGARSNITIRVVPFPHGPYVGQDMDYSIAEYDVEPDKPPVHLVYVDLYGDLTVLHDNRSVAKYQTLWAEQRTAGLSPEESSWFLALLAGASKSP
uniref:helix-turn-helix domain-containing protein n=1 Tax=Pseudonocardia sp. CA-138482 TaxID=3240023 RepID=UPI003F494D70